MIYPDDYLNKIICGDCLDVMKEIPDDSIDLVFTDPPYGINYSSNGGPRVSNQRKPKISRETKISGDFYVDVRWFYEMFRALKNNSALYCFCSWNSYSDFEKKISDSGFKLKTTLIWDKGNCGMGDLFGDYGNQTELIIYAHKGRHILSGGRDRNIIKFQRPADAYRNHPTEKPVDLAMFLLNKSSKENDVILDPFIGSGTTAIACKNAKRNFIGIDISHKYCEIARQRLADG